MNPLSEQKEKLKDEEYRYAYAESFLNSSIATQIVVLREQRNNMTQEELADAIGTKQAGISRFENINYSSWNIKTLKKIARALGCRLRVSFETFGSLLQEDQTFSEDSLQRPTFEADPVFQNAPVTQEVPVDRPPVNKDLDLARGFFLSIQGEDLQELTMPLRNQLGTPRPKILEVAKHSLRETPILSQLLQAAKGQSR